MVSVGNYAIGHLTVNGLDAVAAATSVGYFAIINTVGRLIVGTVSDRINLKHAMIPGALLAMVGCGIMLFARTPSVALLALILTGLGYGVLLTAPQTLLVNYFGVKNYAQINGTYTMISGIIASVPAVIIGACYDAMLYCNQHHSNRMLNYHRANNNYRRVLCVHGYNIIIIH